MASSGIRWKSSRLSKARTQQVSLKLKTEAASKEFTAKYPWNSISAARRLVTLKMQLSILCFLYGTNGLMAQNKAKDNAKPILPCKRAVLIYHVNNTSQTLM